MISLNMTGLDMTFDKLDELQAELLDSIYQATQNASQEVLEQASRNCPVITGNLRRSIKTEVQKLDNGAEGRVYSECEYAGYVHEGTRGRRAKPFMRNALDQCRGRILDYYKSLID